MSCLFDILHCSHKCATLKQTSVTHTVLRTQVLHRCYTQVCNSKTHFCYTQWSTKTSVTHSEVQELILSHLWVWEKLGCSYWCHWCRVVTFHDTTPYWQMSGWVALSLLISARSDPVWSCLILSDIIWSYLILSDPIWSCLILSDSLWSCLIQSARKLW